MQESLLLSMLWEKHSVLPPTCQTAGIAYALLSEKKSRAGPTCTLLRFAGDTGLLMLLIRQPFYFLDKSLSLRMSLQCQLQSSPLKGKWFYSVGFVTLAKHHFPPYL